MWCFKRLEGCLALLLIVMSLTAGCGGGGASVAPGAGQQDPTPTFNYNYGGLANQINYAALGTPRPLTNANDAAPLGTNPAYNMQLISSTDTKTSSRAVSDLASGDPFEIVAVTLSGAGVTNPNFSASGFALEEGSRVKLWVQYRTRNAATNFDRVWHIDDPVGLNTTENVTIASGGTYTTSLDYTLPLILTDPSVAPTVPGNFKITFNGSKSSSMVVRPGQVAFSLTKSIPFSIINRPTYKNPEKCWQMCWEKALNGSDFDYNDLVCRVCAAETVNPDTGLVKQIDIRVKALARGDGYSADWQFNLDSQFPNNSEATSYTQLYKHGGAADGPLRIWRSKNGVSIPVFTPVRNVIPSPNGPTSTVNVIPGETFSQGGYADIRIILDDPIAPGTYTPLPYTNQMLILDTNDSQVYLISLTTNRGGNDKDANGNPLGFILPDDMVNGEHMDWAWSTEGRDLKWAYPRFTDWVYWTNHPELPASAEPKFWLDGPVKTTAGTKNCYDPSFFVGGPSLPIPD